MEFTLPDSCPERAAIPVRIEFSGRTGSVSSKASALRMTDEGPDRTVGPLSNVVPVAVYQRGPLLRFSRGLVSLTFRLRPSISYWSRAAIALPAPS